MKRWSSFFIITIHETWIRIQLHSHVLKGSSFVPDYYLHCATIASLESLTHILYIGKKSDG